MNKQSELLCDFEDELQLKTIQNSWWKIRELFHIRYLACRRYRDDVRKNT